MKQLLFYVLPILAFISSVFDADAGKVRSFNGVKTQYHFSDIRGVVNRSDINVEYFNSDREEVTLHISAEIADQVDVTFDDGIVYVRSYGTLSLTDEVNAVLIVKSPDIETLTVAGKGNILMFDPVTVYNSTSLIVSGTGTMDVKSIHADDLHVMLDGEGQVQIEFLRANRLNCVSTSAGDVLIDDFEGRSVDVRNSGSGDVDFEEMVCETLQAEVTGSGDILCGEGEAVSVNLDGRGSGAIRAASIQAQTVNASATGSSMIFCRADKKVNISTSQRGRVRYCGDAEVYIQPGSDARAFNPTD